MMDIREQLRMAQVKRYPICHTNKEQSVAEHSFGVMLIVVELCKDVRDRELVDCAVAYAMIHDKDEVYSGDIPSPFKRELRAKCPEVIEHLDPGLHVPDSAKAIVKLADYLEAIHFLREYGGSRHAETVLEDIQMNFETSLVKYAPLVDPSVVRRARTLGGII